MSEEKNIPPENFKEEIHRPTGSSGMANSKEENNSSVPIFPEDKQAPIIEKPKTTNPVRPAHPGGQKPQTSDMEVHPHGHVHEKKKWKEYLFQFLMLFLAITLGFFVENQREHYIENKRAKEYARMLTDDLTFDIGELNRANRVLNKIIIAGDSLAVLLSSNEIKKIPGGKLYYYEYWSGWRWKVISRDATLQQLKNSGSMRYMGNTSLIRKIMDYEESLKLIYLLQDKYEPEKVQNWNLVQKVFDQTYFDMLDNIKAASRDSSSKVFLVSDQSLEPFLNTNYPLFTYEKAVWFELKNWAHNSSWSYRVQIGNINSARQRAQIIIEALKNEYHLE